MVVIQRAPGALSSLYLAGKKYGFLLRELIVRDFKVKYKRSALGMLWSLLKGK